MDVAEVVHLANRQFGLVSRPQLFEQGLGRSRLERLLAERLLVRVRPSVFALSGAPRSFHARCMEVQLWADGAGFLSSWTAGRLAGLRRMPDRGIHYTVPRSFGRDQPEGVHLDRSSWFRSRSDRVARDDELVVASAPRMLFGLAKDLRPHAFARAAEDAWHLGLCSPDELSSYLELHRCRGKGGVSTIERWLERAAGVRAPAQSGFEQDLIDHLEREGLPAVVRQHPLRLRSGEMIHLDIAWPDVRLAVEPGNAWFHGGDERQHRDHQRDLACSELGWQVIRIDDRFRADLATAARSIRASHRRRRSPN